MRKCAAAMLFLPIALATCAQAPLPNPDSPKALEAFFFPAAEEAIFDSMNAVFRLDNPGVLVTLAAEAGPAYASRVAATIESPEVRSQYARLAEYLDLFGPCQKKLRPGTEGWWSSFTSYPGEPYCGEVTKLLLAATLWSQVHYCRQLTIGEVKPKEGLPPDHGPPYRLDEPPVKTHWLNTEAVYAVTEAAIALRFQEVLRRRAAEPVHEPWEREAILDAARELDQRSVNRELTGLALLKVILRNYEGVHLRHLRRFQDETRPSSPRK